MRRILALTLVCGMANACGFSHINQDNSTRPETSIGSSGRVIMPGESLPPPEQAPTEQQTTTLGGSEGQVDKSRKTRDVPLGPLAVLFGYPFWIF